MNMTFEWLERQCTNVTKCKTVVRSKYILFNFVFFLYVCNIYHSLAVARNLCMPLSLL